MKSLVLTYLKTNEHGVAVLKQAQGIGIGIGIGFVDGDLELLTSTKITKDIAEKFYDSHIEQNS